MEDLNIQLEKSNPLQQLQTEEIPKKKEINFQEMPKGTNEILNPQEQKAIIDRFMQQTPVAIPMEANTGTSYLHLVLSPNFRDLELMIRGLEYVSQMNPITQKQEIILRKIENHPLNEYGINKILEFIKVWSSPEIKLGRKKTRDYYNSVRQVSQDAKRLIYKNLKNFGMDTQVKQRSAKTYVLAIIEYADASFSRSLEGRENDLSRATEFSIQSNIDGLNDPSKQFFNKSQKDNLKN
jgi:hypothetical protein